MRVVDSLQCGKHLERRHHLGQRHALVAAPLMVVLDAVDKDDKVLVAALVVDLYVRDVSACHFGGFSGFGWSVGRVELGHSRCGFVGGSTDSVWN